MKKRKPRKRKSALRLESERAVIEQIRRNLALPMHKRTNFLRRKLRGSSSGGGGGGGGGSLF